MLMRVLLATCWLCAVPPWAPALCPSVAVSSCHPHSSFFFELPCPALPSPACSPSALPSSLSPSLLARDEVLEESQQGAHGSHELNGGAASITSRQIPLTRASVLASVAANTAAAAAGSAPVLPDPAAAAAASAPAAQAVGEALVGGAAGGDGGTSLTLGSQPAAAPAPAPGAAPGASAALQWQPSGANSTTAASAPSFPPAPQHAPTSVHGSSPSSSSQPVDGGQAVPAAATAAAGASSATAAAVTAGHNTRLSGRLVGPAPPGVGTTGGMAAMAAAEPAAGAGARVLHVNIDANLTDPQQVAMYAPDIYRHLRANEVRLQHCTRLPWLHPQSKEHAWGSSEPLCLPPPFAHGWVFA